MFISIDGIDGSGKTTLARQLSDIFQPTFEVYLTKEPTGYSDWGKRLRRAASEGRLSENEELEYFKLDRKHHIENYIEPALKAGKIVICDRYVDSTLAFQTKSPDEANKLYEEMIDDILVPEVTFIIDCSVKIGMERINIRDDGKFSQFEKIETLKIAESIYRSRAGDNYVHLDGSETIQGTLIQAVNALKGRLEESNPIYQVIELNFKNLSEDPSRSHETAE